MVGGTAGSVIPGVQQLCSLAAWGARRRGDLCTFLVASMSFAHSWPTLTLLYYLNPITRPICSGAIPMASITADIRNMEAPGTAAVPTDTKVVEPAINK